MSEHITPLSNGRIELHVQRHDAHEQGHLTPEGQEHAKETAEKKVKNYLNADSNTHFLVIASDQRFDEREPDLGGQRARETATIITDVIRKELAERQLPAEQLFGHEDQELFTTTQAIREADIFSNDFMKHLRETYPDENAWSLYYQDTDADQRIKMGAESPLHLAQRMDYMIKTAEMVGASFHKTPGKENSPLVLWLVGHGGGLDSYLHHYANVPLNELGFDLSDGFTIHAHPEYGVVANVKGKEYPVHTSESIEQPE